MWLAAWMGVSASMVLVACNKAGSSSSMVFTASRFMWDIRTNVSINSWDKTVCEDIYNHSLDYLK
jgi:hypothetical protein